MHVIVIDHSTSRRASLLNLRWITSQARAQVAAGLVCI